jgi:LPXTG-motif cell wall-anchored protein
MNIKSKRILAVSTIIALSGLLINPAIAEDPVTTAAIDTATAVVTTAAPVTGIIHVQNIVVNDNIGTKTATDFEFTIKHFGTNVEGSPFSVTEAAGTNFTLEPGTYVVAVAYADGYLGSWTGEGIENGFINLKAGQEITITRNTYDLGIAAPVYPSTTTTVDPVTEDGGILPVTGTNWFNALALGLLLSAAGALAFRKNSLSN